ncbi:MAG: hypothetical protein MZV65_27975 [Chromatiales bacterium]|nr:hypothetical protein [Chromatiales bacterium]
MGIETQIGLGVIRELGRAGVEVIGLAQQVDAIGLASRFLSRGVLIHELRSEALIETIRALGEELGECCIMAISESNIGWLIDNRDRFGKVSPVIPNPVAWETVLDKSRTLAAARALGLRVPETHEPDSLEAVEQIAESFRFPAVLKWKDPAAVMPLLAQRGLDFHEGGVCEFVRRFSGRCGSLCPHRAMAFGSRILSWTGAGAVFFHAGWSGRTPIPAPAHCGMAARGWVFQRLRRHSTHAAF